MTTAVTSIQGQVDAASVARALSDRHLHLRSGSSTKFRCTPFFVDLWADTADCQRSLGSPGTSAKLDRFLENGGRFELCDAAQLPIDWSVESLYRKLLIPEFSLRDTEQPLSETLFRNLLRSSVWFALAWTHTEPVAVAILLPNPEKSQARLPSFAQPSDLIRDRLVIAARSADARNLLWRVIPTMLGEEGVSWIRIRRRPWVVSGEFSQWLDDLECCDQIVCGWRAPEDRLILRPQILSSSEAILCFCKSARHSSLELQMFGTVEEARRLHQRLNEIFAQKNVEDFQQ